MICYVLFSMKLQNKNKIQLGLANIVVQKILLKAMYAKHVLVKVIKTIQKLIFTHIR